MLKETVDELDSVIERRPGRTPDIPSVSVLERFIETLEETGASAEVINSALRSQDDRHSYITVKSSSGVWFVSWRCKPELCEGGYVWVEFEISVDRKTWIRYDRALCLNMTKAETHKKRVLKRLGSKPIPDEMIHSYVRP